MELLLIRHGLPQRVENIQGQPADPCLSPLGHEQAVHLAEWLNSESLDALYSSPLRRAIETAQPTAAQQSLPVEIDPGLSEFDADSSTYIPLEELKKTDYAQWKSLMENGYLQEAEFEAFCNRVESSLTNIINRHHGQRIAVVCHGGVINVWTAMVVGFKPRLFFNAAYTSINRYMIASTGERSVVTLNLAVHLDDRRFPRSAH